MKIRSSSGFTLVEILVVVVLIGVLFGTMGDGIMKRFRRISNRGVIMRIEKIKEALFEYQTAFNEYPTTKEGLEALIRNPRPNDPKYKAKEKTDFWELISESDIENPPKGKLVYNCPPVEETKKYKEYEILWVNNNDNKVVHDDGV